MVEEKNNINKNETLVKIRSKYIIIKIFENLDENRLLNIIHYNKKYQKLMNKKIKDYKNAFSTIEIEIIPKENTYGKFFSNYSKSVKSNIKIYFNDDYKKEIKTNKITKDDKVKKIKIIINHKIKSLCEFFYNCKCIKKINFIKFNKDDIKNMSWMFYKCSSLEEINLSKFNTENVTDIRGMFFRCSSLKELDLSNFKTDKVIRSYFFIDECYPGMNIIGANELIKNECIKTYRYNFK